MRIRCETKRKKKTRRNEIETDEYTVRRNSSKTIGNGRNVAGNKTGMQRFMMYCN